MKRILSRARIVDDAPLCDVVLANGLISAVVPRNGARAQPADDAWDLDGKVLLPGLVDIHTHLDKTFSTTANRSGTLNEAIDIWLSSTGFHTPESFYARARRALDRAIAHGTTAMRTHVNAVTAADLGALEAILTLRQEMRDRIDLQIVTLGHPSRSAELLELMRTALRMGADLVGGCPALEDDCEACLRCVFNLSEEFGKPVDLHVDETEDPAMLTLERVAEHTMAAGMHGRVTAGHCVSLAFADEPTAARVIDKVARAGVTVVTLPSCNLVLMGRGRNPAPRGVTRVKQLLDAGVNVCASSDNVRDPFNPFGDYDLLHIANLAAHVAHMSGEDEVLQALDCVTVNPARCFGLEAGIVPGAPADLVVVDCDRVADAVLTVPARLATFKHGVVQGVAA